jgi:hypothetical protein
MRRLSVASLLVLALSALSLPTTASAQTFTPQPINVISPDLSVSLTSSASVVGGGEQVTFTLVVTNVGQVAFREPTGSPVYWNAPANGISLLQSLPSGATFRSVAAAGGGFSCAHVAPVVTCSGGSLQAGSTATITVVASAPLAAGSFGSTATVDPTNAIVERNESNNAATVSMSVPQADLALAVASSAASVDDQASLTYWAYIDNLGPAAEASGVTLRLTLPGGASLWSWRDGETSWLFGTRNQAGFSCSGTSGVVTCSGGRIPSGARGTVTFTVTAPRMHGTMTPSFAVDPNNTIGERDESNNAASVNTTVVGRVDLTVEVTHSFFPPLTRRISVRNVGAGPASGVQVTIEARKWEYFDDGGPDTLVGVFADSGFTCTRQPYVAGSYLNYNTGDVITCTGGSIAAGGTATISAIHLPTTTDDSRITDATVDPANTIREPFENNNHDTASSRF